MAEDRFLTKDMDEDRRKFLVSCGKFAVVTPPAITLLLSTSLNSRAVALSGGRGSDRHEDRFEHRHEHEYHHNDRDKDSDDRR